MTRCPESQGSSAAATDVWASTHARIIGGSVRYWYDPGTTVASQAFSSGEKMSARKGLASKTLERSLTAASRAVSGASP